MTENQATRERIGRILRLIGRLLCEVGELQRCEERFARAAEKERADSGAHPEARPAQEPIPVTARDESKDEPTRAAVHDLVGRSLKAIFEPGGESDVPVEPAVATHPLSAQEIMVLQGTEEAPSPGSEVPAGSLRMSLTPESLPGSRRVWVVSPSTLARRFLTSHLAEMGIDAFEARDLEDSMLPADLSSLGGLFLDENLLESWRARPAKEASPPIVLLTVDLPLSVPPLGSDTGQAAVLPRPFERSEVERVVSWLRSLPGDTQPREAHARGSEEDDTWLLADPFGTAGTREHPRR